MLEPVQNCFTFYHPDGISSAHEYSVQDESPEKQELNTKPSSTVVQQNLSLPLSEDIKDS